MNNVNGSCRRCAGVNTGRYLQNTAQQGRCSCGGYRSYENSLGGCEGGHCANAREGQANGDFDYALAMVYSNVQQFRYVYDCEAALGRGTIFAELDKPFEGMTVTGCRR